MTTERAPLKDAGDLARECIVYGAITVVACGHAILAVVIVTGFLTGHFPDWLNGSDRHNQVRNVIEFLYFLSSLGLVVVAILALRFAKSQADQSRRQNDLSTRTAQAAVYMRLVERIACSEMVLGGQLRTLVVQQHAASDGSLPLGAFASQCIEALDDDTHGSFIGFLIFLEDIGLLARRRYLSMDDVFHLLEGPLKEFNDVFLFHLEKMRAASYQQRMCDNAIWLLKEIVGYTPQETLPPERKAPRSV
ncbi:MAG TPA: hypothetical protein VGN75_09945 [Kaistia sp.]|nr:hypothetical protein [Kaistia sp.]